MNSWANGNLDRLGKTVGREKTSEMPTDKARSSCNGNLGQGKSEIYQPFTLSHIDPSTLDKTVPPFLTASMIQLKE
jgi:hypothetical protein